MRRLLANLLLCLFSLLAIALAGEAVVRVLQHQGYLPDYAQKQAPRKQQQTAQDAGNAYNPKLKKSGNPLLHVEYDTSDPRVNAFGMRGPLPLLEKTPGTYRIAVLGDSVAFGFGLPREQSFTYLLENRLHDDTGKAIEVLNFAVIGYGLEANLEVYRQKVRPFRPDLVLLTYVLNDMTPPGDVFVVIRDVMKEQARIKRVARVSQFAAWLVVTWKEAMKGIESDRSFTGLYEDPATAARIAALLASLQQDVAADGASLRTVVFPYFTELQAYPFTGVHQAVANALQQTGIAHVDLLDTFRRHEAATLQLQAGDITHPNSEGNRIAAEAVAAYLLQQQLPPR